MNFMTLNLFYAFKFHSFGVMMFCVTFYQESTSSKKATTDADKEEGEGSDKSKSDVEDDGEVC